MMSGTPTLSLTVHGAQNLDSVEMIGKQDPYFRFSLNYNDAKSFQKTFVHKDGGKNPTWNQTFNVTLNGEPEIYIEIMDDETTVDAPIAFAAIPISQAVYASGGSLNGTFDVYTPKGKQTGQVTLTLAVHNVPGQNTGAINQASVHGTSHINEGHQKRIQSLKSKEAGADVATTGLAGIAAVGAGLLINKYMNDKEKEEKAKKEAEAAAQAERERFDAERKKFEQDREAFALQQQHQQQQFQQQQQQFQQQSSHGGSYQESHSSSSHKGYKEHKEYKDKKHYKKDKKHGGNRSGSDSDSDSGSDSDGSYKKKDKKKWNPTGSYSSGDKIKFDGRKYVCLQAHTSNPTWRPDSAHSLWKAL
ncbi:hypothetical protein DFQ27_008864 [Actinomortierella ambigua]|uniref:C2 domain-containing protein n=1 Tax=Actinomortierella ambigua TaxID=1343610 RepID=A0A9P6QJZ7_9FUNG|nr:hypothetical protein DFQ26_000402 [Actinomortierella ambigua]KAG0267304.1 hypothetical protein DFQ27_008864 [Actinomortierella ambigua]